MGKRIYFTEEEKKTHHKISIQKYYENNKEKIRKKHKEYYENNKENVLKRCQKNRKNKIKTDINFKISCNLRRRVRRALNGDFKKGSAVKDLGCSIPEFKLYLESKFQPGMTWDNYGYWGWHIDHIIPLSSFNLQNKEEFLKACNYTNLQPLWAVENLKKYKN